MVAVENKRLRSNRPWRSKRFDRTHILFSQTTVRKQVFSPYSATVRHQIISFRRLFWPTWRTNLELPSILHTKFALVLLLSLHVFLSRRVCILRPQISIEFSLIHNQLAELKQKLAELKQQKKPFTLQSKYSLLSPLFVHKPSIRRAYTAQSSFRTI